MVAIKTMPQSGSGDIRLDDLAFKNGFNYKYQVEAVDARGNCSGLAGKLTVTPNGGTEWVP